MHQTGLQSISTSIFFISSLNHLAVRFMCKTNSDSLDKHYRIPILFSQHSHKKESS